MIKSGALNDRTDPSDFRGLYRFIGKGGIFTSVLIFSVVCLEIFLRSMPNSYKEKRTKLVNQKDRIEILVLGSSHSFFGLNPEYFSAPAYNMAHVSQTFSLDFELLKEFGPSLSQLRTIVLPLSLQSLYDIGEDLPSIYRNYVLYYGLPNCKGWQYSYELQQPTAFRQAVSRLFSLSKSSDFTVNSFGFGTSYGTASKETSSGTLMQTLNRHFGEGDRAVVPEELKALSNILEWAALHRLRVILLATPVSDDYYSLVPKRIKEEVDSIAKSYLSDTEKVIYLDWNQIDEFDQSDFYDWDHLNNQGAKKLTILLDDALQRLK